MNTFPENCFSLCWSGDVSVSFRKHPKVLHHTEEAAKAAASSLQAFVLYHRLYECWWRTSGGSQEIQNGLSLSLADSSPEDEVKDEVSNGGLLESAETHRPVSGSFHKLGLDPSLLLCEPHAACQATQRAVRQIQQQLAAMVQQHSQTQGGQLDSGEKRDDSPAVISTTRESSDSQDSAEAEQGWELCASFLCFYCLYVIIRPMIIAL